PSALDPSLRRLSDLILTLPLLAVAAMLAHNFGGSWWLISLVIAGLYWAYVSRVARGVVLSLREKEFIEAARALGASDARIIFRHLVPNALGASIDNATVLVALAILLETALSYLVFVVRPPHTSLGIRVSEAASALTSGQWLFYCPGLFIILVALSSFFSGGGLRGALGPQPTRVRARPARRRRCSPPRRPAGKRRGRRTAWCSRSRTSPSASPPTTGSCRPSAASATSRAGARCWASAASRGPASRSPRWPSWGCCPARPGSPGRCGSTAGS